MNEARVRELISEAVTAARAGTPAVINIEGDAGFGKSRLLREIRSSLTGFTVRRAYGEPDAPDVAGRVIEEFIGGGASLERANTLHAVRVLQEHVDLLQADGPVCLIVDDLQWADAESVRALAGLMRRSDGDRLLIIAAARPLRRVHPEWHRMLADLDARRIVLDGLDVDAVADLIGPLDANTPHSLAVRLHEHTAGNPLHLTALLREHTHSELAAMAAIDELPAPLQLASHMEERVSLLSADAAALLAALAVLGDGWVPREIADTVAGVTGDEASGLLIHEGLARARGGSKFPELRLFHSVMRAAVYEIIPAEQRFALHRVAAGVVIERGARLRHRLAANGTRPNPELAAELVAYAEEQHDLGHYRDAGLFLRLAARTAHSADQRRALLLDADVEALLGRDPGAARTDLVNGDARDRLVVAMSFANRSDWRSAWSTLTPVAAQELDSLPGLKAFQLLALRAWSAAGCGRPAESILTDVASAEALPADLAVYGLLQFGRVQALAQTSDELSLWRLSAHGADRQILAASAEGAVALAWRGVIYVLNGFFAEGIADLSLATGLIGEGALDFNDGILHSLLGFAYLASGDLARATISIDVARGTGEDLVHPISLSCSSIRRILGGDDLQARADAEAARSRLLRDRLAGGIYVADIVDVVLLSLDGTDAEQRTWARRRWIELGDPVVLLAASRTPALWVLAIGLAQAWVGDPQTADAFADDLEAREVVPSFGRDMVEWLRLRAAASRGESVANRYADLVGSAFHDVPLLRTILLSDAAAFALPPNVGDASRPSGTNGNLTSIFELSPHLRLPDEATGGARIDDESLGVVAPFMALTERERAVAALVVDGMSYAQIAKELFVTRSTVAFHLSNCYAKTGTSSRHELAQLARSFGAPTLASVAS